MSCVAMAVTNLALHAHVQERVPKGRLGTHVDNWEGLDAHPCSLVASYEALTEFTRAWDILLDEGKTFAWASDPRDCKALRDHGFHTALHCRDLGAHMNLSKQATNATLTRRLSSLDPLWMRLRMSTAPARQKVSALATAAWPKAFYGIANVHVGESHFRRLRAGFSLLWPSV